MLAVMTNSWALLLGIFLMMIGNGLQGSVLGVRGGIEDFGNLTMGFVMSGYFLGFIGGSQVTPWLLRRVGHVRVFAAMASLISAAMILYAAVVHPAAWIFMRITIGFCMCSVYIVAESWLNASSDNSTRGKALSAYMMMQTLGVVVAQVFLNVADPAGYDLFVIMAVAVSVAVVPILLSASPAPVFETARRMSLGDLFRASPLGVVGTVLLGGVFACMFGMASVYGAQIGLSTAEISIFIGAIYMGGLVFQYPIGWLSDRMDRRHLIIALTLVGVGSGVLGFLSTGDFVLLTVSSALVGGVAHPLYGLLVAHTNDYLEREQMASASGGLLMLNGIGATGTPIFVGYMMDVAGAETYMVAIFGLMGLITLYGLYRMTVRPSVAVADTLPMALAPVGTSMSQVGSEMMQEVVVDRIEAAEAAEVHAAEVDAAEARLTAAATPTETAPLR